MQPANKRLVTEAAVPAHIENEVTTPGTPTQAALSATYVTFRNFDGSPVTGKHVEITLTADGTDIDNIRVVTP